MPAVEYAGWWWLPEDPDDEIPGTLSFSEQAGWRLSLLGSFRRCKKQGEPGSLGDTVSLILGLIPKERVTLVSSTPISRRVNVPGYDTIDYQVGIAYIGEFAESMEALRFSELNFQPTHLTDWLAETKVYWHPPVRTESGTKYEFGYEHQQVLFQDIDNGKVAIAYSMSTDVTAFSGAIKVRPVVRFQMQEPLSIDDWRHGYLLPVANLLSLATGQPAQPAGVTVFLRDGDERTSVKVIARNLPDRQQEEPKPTFDRILFSHRELNGSFSDLLNQWLKTHAELESVLSLYFSIARSPSMYLEHQFLSVAQALEGYHRHRCAGLDVAPEVHEARLSAIIQTAPSEYRGWLKEKLRYSNEKGLRRRLHELIERAGEAFNPWVQTPKQKVRFVNRVVDARNALTHYVPGESERKVDADTLFVLTEALTILMQTLLLGELGFDDEKRARLFKQNQRYQFAAGRAAGAK